MAKGTSQPGCRICGSMDLEEFLDIGEMPVFCNVLYPDAESARAAPRGRITLAWCC